MRTLLSLLLMTFGFVAEAATPTLTNFFPKQFIITPNGPATNVIKLRLNPVQFDTNAGTITIKGSFTNQGGLNIFNTTNLFVNTTNIYIDSTTIETNTITILDQHTERIYNSTNYISYSVISNVNTTIINTNVTINNYGTTNYYTNTIIRYEGVTNYFTNVIENYSGVTNNYTNTVFIMTNSTIVINGTNVATINPTDTYIPYRVSSNAFGDSSLHQVSPTEVDGWDSVWNSLSTISSLTTFGSFRTLSVSTAVVTNGTNVINPYQQAFIVVISTSTNAVVQLDTGNGVGSHLWLVNFWTNAMFTLNEGPLADDPTRMVWLRGGQWHPTQPNEILKLVQLPGGWDEEDRCNPNGPPPATQGDLVWTNDSGRMRLVSTNTVQVLELQGNDGLGAGTLEFWNGGTKRWTMATGVLYPEANYDIGTSLNPVQTLWLDGLTGIKLSALRISENAGSPENAVIAPVGSLYLQNDGGPGTTLWTKTNGAGNTGWSTVGGGTGTTINATDTYLPARMNATTFTNSPLYTVAGTNVATDGQIIFGPHTTNVLKITAGVPNFVSEEATGDASLVFSNTNHSTTADIGVTTGGEFLRTSGDALNVYVNNTDQFSIMRALYPTRFVLLPDITAKWGLGEPFRSMKDGSFFGTVYVEGFANNPDYSRLAVSHTGTNGAVVFDSQADGAAGSPKEFEFKFNGVTNVTIAVDGSMWISNNCSALSFTDRSRSPDSVADAYKIVRSHHAKSGRVDHVRLDPLAYGRRGATNDPATRDIGMVLSAQAMVIQDLEDRLTKTENALKLLQK